jgi:hypothetical protein
MRSDLHLCDRFQKGLPIKILYAFIIRCMRATCAVQCSVPNLTYLPVTYTFLIVPFVKFLNFM